MSMGLQPMLMSPPVSNKVNSDGIIQSEAKEVQTKVILVATDRLLEAISTCIRTYDMELK
jgi:hypothetical protein